MKTCLRSTTLLLALFTAGPALADGGTLYFTGEIFESGCTLNASASATESAVPVAPDLYLEVRDENDACARGYSAFTATLEPLIARELNVDGQVITVTYN